MIYHTWRGDREVVLHEWPKKLLLTHLHVFSPWNRNPLTESELSTSASLSQRRKLQLPKAPLAMFVTFGICKYIYNLMTC